MTWTLEKVASELEELKWQGREYDPDSWLLVEGESFPNLDKELQVASPTGEDPNFVYRHVKPFV